MKTNELIILVVWLVCNVSSFAFWTKLGISERKELKRSFRRSYSDDFREYYNDFSKYSPTSLDPILWTVGFAGVSMCIVANIVNLFF